MKKDLILQNPKSDLHYSVIVLSVLIIHGFFVLSVFHYIKGTHIQDTTKPKFVVKTIKLDSPKKKRMQTVVPKPKPKPKPKSKLKTQPKQKKKVKPKPKPKTQKKIEKKQLDQEAIKKLESVQASLSQLAMRQNTSTAITLPEELATLQIETQKPMRQSELKYIDLLATHLRASLRLPNEGDVEIKLTLKRNGAVQKLEILSSENQENQIFVQSKLPNLQFPPFDTYIKNEQTYTFLITLRGDA